MSKYDDSIVTILFENGEIIKIPYSDDLMPKLLEVHSGANPCCECHNFSNCPKIWDAKQEIDKYSFIEKGYMIQKKSGEILAFAIDECNNFEKEPPKEKITFSKSRQAKKNLKDYYELAYHREVESESPVVEKPKVFKKVSTKDKRKK